MSSDVGSVAKITSSDYVDVNLHNLHLTVNKQLNGLNFNLQNCEQSWQRENELADPQFVAKLFLNLTTWVRLNELTTVTKLDFDL
jgi:hypothetical protein